MSDKTVFLFRSYVKESDRQAIIDIALDRAERSRDAVLALKGDYSCAFLAPGADVVGMHERIAERLGDSVMTFSHDGDANSEALTCCIQELSELGFGRVVIASNKAADFITDPVMDGAEFLFGMGCRAVGVALPELSEFVYSGCLQNTFALWDIKSLLELDPPGFDSKIGVEEISVLIRMFRAHGPCIGVVEIGNLSGELDVRTSTEAREHHSRIMATKQERHDKEALRVSGSLDEIRAGRLQAVNTRQFTG